ncbi:MULTISPECIES: TRADD-N-associated membrane domain-containing protein [Vibrio]|uniref:TRADD-N-associated membrane domain-containing protein n=1 Tax=Vibrio TaxID=662 RepID=UPI001481E609|nr:hypothetical protein [Vibrio fluvialis]MBE5158955.1 hypothetical protein [Vibrio parahaemolyticus]NNO00311.1 hypothetical protein [Vibrio sp. B1-2]HAS6299991.1 hypothetical protein [Vibrio vulnificus]MBY8292385.1 hypothetical protein [Vibrio fluvialis]WPK55025.1 hypothetical protein NAF16_15105 [Vibrio fluvialis]
MSIEVTLLTTVLANALGSSGLAESLVKLFKEKLDKKTIDDSGSDEITAAEPKRLYLAGDQESKIVNEAAIEALDETYMFTAGIAAERMRQAKAAFNIALTLMIVGVLIIFAGVALLYFKEGIEQGLITVVVGAVSEILSVIVFGFNRETNNRLDDLRKDMSVIETARVGLSFAKQIENQEKRDNAISELSLKIQGG